MVGWVVLFNPASFMRDSNHIVETSKTSILGLGEASQFLGAINIDTPFVPSRSHVKNSVVGEKQMEAVPKKLTYLVADRKL